MHKTKRDMKLLLALRIVMVAGNLIIAVVAIIVAARWYLYALGFVNAGINFVTIICQKIELKAQLRYEHHLEEMLNTFKLPDSSI